MDSFSAFRDLPQSEVEGVFSAVSVSLSRGDFLAKGIHGEPIFLLHDASAVTYVPSVDFLRLSAQFHATCRVKTAERELQDQFAIVSCDANTPELHEIFIKSFGAAIEGLPQMCETRDLSSVIQGLIDLFRGLTRPGIREVSGLWGELFVIYKSESVSRALDVWHSDGFERFDFSSEKSCLEVKSTLGEMRTHNFALEQLLPPLNGKGYVASLLLQRLHGGLGVLDLANLIERQVMQSLPLKQKLWSNLTKSLGSDFAEKLDSRFDTSYAERNLILYEMSDIPQILDTRDSRVSNVRFVADLTTVASSMVMHKQNGLETIFRHF